ncbi:hypothetical protein HNR44_000660 [Geomicrobium halophilum]|uniref:Pyridinium-3,5-bisthiocarboxylic acid mononucleotide nickel insertion protein n=1 Tax=Geomicrobium halophilum TaxID=549000 RepID=A0A841PQZ0_9BACL|nr:nickel pincer cofactor biosynthesis protein LarC [Geomicrobium halophilum]MBB6448711.1 hypothetical protein [Geomicrobium halophilum]
MKILYIDTVSGIAGDMTLAALADLGVNLEQVAARLRTLPIDAFSMDTKDVIKKGISSKQLLLTFDEEHGHHYLHDHVHNHGHHNDHTHNHDHHHRRASDILEMISDSELPERVKLRSTKIFEVIAESEGRIHGMDPKDVHFHEVGAMDSIIDIIGVCLALEQLDVDQIIASPVPPGSGKLNMAHGLYPIPAPATTDLLKGIPLASLDVNGELTTPTGAGILKALSAHFGSIPAGRILGIGYGAGKKDFPHHPNVLRVLLMEDVPSHQNQERVHILECQVDDMTGEALGYTMERLFEAGVLDAYYTPVHMKKNRPGTLITALVDTVHAEQVENCLLQETSTFGVRRTEAKRRPLNRRVDTLSTPLGEVRVKVGYDKDKTYQTSLEYEDIKRIAERENKPFGQVYREILYETYDN